MAHPGSSLSKLITDMFMKEQSVLEILKKTKHVRKIRQYLNNDLKKVAPILTPYVHKLADDYERDICSINLFITKLTVVLRLENKAADSVKKCWKWLVDPSVDEPEQEKYESANEEAFAGEEEEKYESANEDAFEGEEEEELDNNLDSIIRLSEQLVQAIRELKGAELEDGELEQVLRDLMFLPQLVDSAAHVTAGDLPARVREASIHDRGTFCTRNDRNIVWPPMVILVNTKCCKDSKSGKWQGVEDVQDLQISSLSRAVGSRVAYGPQGHRGMNILIFDASAVGFMEAELLDKSLERSGRGREGYCRTDRVLIYPDGNRKHYGYMAEKSDIDNFNKYFQGKSRIRIEMKSYQDMVVNPMKQTSGDYKILNSCKDLLNRRAHMEKFINMLPWEARGMLPLSYYVREIVWPPVVIVICDERKRSAIENAIENVEVLKYYVNVCRNVTLTEYYGPPLGVKAITFEATAVGFMEAYLLSEYMEERIKDEDGCSCPVMRLLNRECNLLIR